MSGIVPESPEAIKKHTDIINNMSHSEMARLYRFAVPGHMYFDVSMPYNKIFMKRFNDFGGMTSALSKEIGW